MKYAICNETFEGWDHGRVCQFVAETGYTGLELAPFTLAPLVTQLNSARRAEIRKQAEEHGLSIVGLHWLLAKTEGLHLNSAERAVRERTADYLVELGRCCRDLGGELMVFGSPAQRKIQTVCTREQAIEYAAETFRSAMPRIANCNIKVCFEPLAPVETEFVNTCAEGIQLIEMVDHPMFTLHLDVKAMSAEAVPVPELIRQFGPKAGHFHANDPNRRGPGFGKTDFVPIFKALRDIHYQGWVSVEVFDYSPDPETIARESLHYMKGCEKAASAMA